MQSSSASSGCVNLQNDPKALEQMRKEEKAARAAAADTARRQLLRDSLSCPAKDASSWLSKLEIPEGGEDVSVLEVCLFKLRATRRDFHDYCTSGRL